MMKSSVHAAKDAALIVIVVNLAANHFVAPFVPKVQLCCREHPEYWRRQVNPEVVPNPRWKSGSEGTGRVHAHPRKWGFNSDVSSDQRPGYQWCVRRQPWMIGEVKNRRHHA